MPDAADEFLEILGEAPDAGDELLQAVTSAPDAGEEFLAILQSEPAPDTRSEGTAQEDMLRKREATPPVDVSPALQEMDEVAANIMVSDSKTVLDTLGKLEAAGVEGALSGATTDWVEDAKVAGTRNYLNFIAQKGIDKLAGLQDVKQRMKKRFIAQETMARQPVPENELRKLTRSSMLKLAETRINTIMEQMRGSGGEGREEAERLAGYYQQLKGLDEDAIYHLYRYGLWDVHKNPVNSQESKLIEEAKEEVFLPSLPLAREAMRVVHEEQQKPNYLHNNLPYLRDPSAQPSLKLTPENVRYMWRQLMGPEAMLALTNEVTRGRAEFTRERTGLLNIDGQLVPGRTSDGTDKIVYIPAGDLELLTNAQVEQTIKGDPLGEDQPKDVQATLARIRKEEGPEAAADAYKLIVQEQHKALMQQAADFAATPPELEPGMTPTEKEAGNIISRLAIGALQDMETVFKGTAQLLRDVDDAVSSSAFVRETFAQGMVTQFAGDQDQAARTKTLRDALGFTMRSFIQGHQGISTFKQRMKETGLNINDPVARDLLLAIDQARVPAVHEYYKNYYELTDDRNEYLSKFLGGKIPWTAKSVGAALGAAAEVTAGMFMVQGAEILGQFVDDPAQVAGMLAGGKALHTGGKPFTKALGETGRHVAYSWRLQTQLGNLMRHHPYKLKSFVDTAKNLLADGLDVTGKLNGLVASVENFMSKRNIEGVGKSAGEAARIVARAWPELKDELGSLGYALGTKLIRQGTIAQITDFFGKGIRPNKDIASLIHLDKSFDGALRAVQDMTGGRGDALVFEGNYRKFVKEQERVPTTAELRGLMPDSMIDLHNLMVAAERNNLKDPFTRRLFTAVTGRPIADFAGVVGTAEATMNSYIQGTLALMDATRQFGLPRDRAGIFLDVAQRRLRSHTQTLEMELDLLRKQPRSEEIAGQIARAEEEHFRTKHEGGLLAEAEDKLWKHNPSQPWDWPTELRDVLFKERPDHSTFSKGLLNGEIVDQIMRLNPALFEGMTPESLWVTQRHPLSKAARDILTAENRGLRKKISDARTKLTKAKERAVEGDKTIQGLMGYSTRLQNEITTLVKNGAKETDPLLVQKRAALALASDQITYRSEHIKAGAITPPHVEEARTAMELAVEQHKQHTEMRNRKVTEGVVRKDLNPATFKAVLDLAKHSGLSEVGKTGLRLLEDDRAAMGAMKALKLPGNPYDPRWLPTTLKSTLANDAVHISGARMQARVQRAEDLADVLNNMSQVERDLMGEAQREGVRPSKLIEKYPALKQIYKDADALNTVASNLDLYWEREGATFREFWQLLSATGRIPEHVMAEFRKANLDPRFYTADQTEQFATTKKAVKAVGREAQLGPHPELSALSQSWNEMQFRREPNKYRVRVVEANKVVDRLFDTKEALNEYMDATYGEGAWDKIGKVDGGIQRGKTIYNEDISVGHPLTDRERLVLGEVLGRTPEARLRSLRAGLQDAHKLLLTEVLNHYGGMVLDSKQYLDYVGTNANLKSQYTQIPENMTSWGPLAGKYMHQKVLQHLEQAAKTYESIQGMLEGYHDAVQNPAFPTSFGEAAGQFMGKVASVTGINYLNKFVKSNVILKNPPTWIANHIFNIIGSHLTGAKRAVSVEGLPHMFDKIVRERPGGPTVLFGKLGQGGKTKADIAWLRLKEPYLDEAREHGLVGGLFESESEAFRAMNRRVFGLDPKEKATVERTLLERKHLYDRLREEQLREGGGNTNELQKLSNEITVREEALREANRSWNSKVGRKLAHIFLEIGERDAVGRPTSQWWHNMRRWYNHIDEVNKLTQFVDLREGGMPAELAARRIRMFNQDYANMPRWVRGLAKSPLGSLVVSFPHELAKIGKNAMLYEPARFLGVITALPFLNMMQFSQAGIGWDRARAMLDARGQKGALGAGLALFSNLYLTDPRTRSLSSEIGLGSLLPYAGLFATRGPLARIYDNVIPEEQRTMIEETMGLGVGVLSQFVGSAPVFNGITYLSAGEDPKTGAKLTDKSMPWPNKLWTLGKLFAGDILPPAGPLGRDFMALLRSTEAPVSPKTGRLRGADELTTASLRALSRVTVRGNLAQKIGSVLGINTRSKDPTLVDDNDLIMTTTYDVSAAMNRMGVGDVPSPQHGEAEALRGLLLRSVDNSITPGQRAKAKMEAEAMSRSLHEFNIRGGVSGELPTVTDRELRLIKQKTIKGGVADFFAFQPVHVQGATLALLDQYQLPDDRMRELTNKVMYSDTLSLRWPRDPQLVQAAIDSIDQRIAVPGHSPHLDKLRVRLGQMLNYAKVFDTKDRVALEPAREMKKAIVEKVLSK